MVWIEIARAQTMYPRTFVTTLRVVWIEILHPFLSFPYPTVTTLRVVWIEIELSGGSTGSATSHHLAGGVD